jgi:hypothetical protein
MTYPIFFISTDPDNDPIKILNCELAIKLMGYLIMRP